MQTFTVKSQIKLTKGSETKIVYVENEITQKFNNLWSPIDYCEAYTDGTAEDVTIKETKFEEYTTFASVWNGVDKKYESKVEAVKETDALTSSFYVNIGGETYRLSAHPTFSPTK